MRQTAGTKVTTTPKSWCYLKIRFESSWTKIFLGDPWYFQTCVTKLTPVLHFTTTVGSDPTTILQLVCGREVWLLVLTGTGPKFLAPNERICTTKVTERLFHHFPSVSVQHIILSRIFTPKRTHFGSKQIMASQHFASSVSEWMPTEKISVHVHCVLQPLWIGRSLVTKIPMENSHVNRCIFWSLECFLSMQQKLHCKMGEGTVSPNQPQCSVENFCVAFGWWQQQQQQPIWLWWPLHANTKQSKWWGCSLILRQSKQLEHNHNVTPTIKKFRAVLQPMGLLCHTAPSSGELFVMCANSFSSDSKSCWRNPLQQHLLWHCKMF